MRKPRYLYHESRPSRRHSIETTGLDPERGLRRHKGCGQRLVFMTSQREDCTPFGDIWRIDTRGITVVQHEGEETWWLSGKLVSPANLKLIQAAS